MFSNSQPVAGPVLGGWFLCNARQLFGVAETILVEALAMEGQALELQQIVAVACGWWVNGVA
ncbi:hypothetical protein N7462_003608 [Penicillium macrosclerotiorum]|uniref:uncharacterized protein n=1 Tax=Penicillium macrosclerotiorum TaxID=303699 RepID=UPI00254924D4|nr:uncharacterized protein N7462_003608 [Penicillium macrosclerotiorum]KAJ5689216.1 hypothetical protein N7462_003608 [Penicillium macrosclerotiorum]